MDAAPPTRDALEVVASLLVTHAVDRVRGRETAIERLAQQIMDAMQGGSPRLDELSCPTCGRRFDCCADKPVA